MQREQIVFVGTSDLSGHFRGKSFPAADLPARLQRGVGLAPTNIFISAFGPIQMTTFGTVGEVFLIPDVETRVFVAFEGSAPEYFLLGDIKTSEGEPWNFCSRHILRRALDRLASRDPPSAACDLRARIQLLAASPPKAGNPTTSTLTGTKASSAKRCSPPCGRPT